ncbi:hypothetical protein Tco_1328899 [Tanacetum coccineum]
MISLKCMKDTIKKEWYAEFKVDERVVWVDIEGLRSVAWTQKKFTKLAGRWGELLYIENPNYNNLWRKRLCLKMKMKEFIMDSLKIIIKGNVYGLRAMEIIGWNPGFIEDASKSGTHVESEGSEDSLPYTDYMLTYSRKWRTCEGYAK